MYVLADDAINFAFGDDDFHLILISYIVYLYKDRKSALNVVHIEMCAGAPTILLYL